MAKILYVKGNPKASKDSKCLTMGEKFINEYKNIKPDDEIIEVDLFNDAIVGLDKDLLYFIEHAKENMANENVSQNTLDKVERYNKTSEQFMEADKYIFSTPLWNLALPDKVKTYIDAVCIAGKTFKYTAKGPIGLLQNKKCVHLHASGGFHSNESRNHGEPYLKDVMSFMGINDYKSIIAEGYAALPDQADALIGKAYAQIPAVAKWFAN